jgi:hypothetical protein
VLQRDLKDAKGLQLREAHRRIAELERELELERRFNAPDAGA